MHGGSGTGQVEDALDLDIQGKGHVVALRLEEGIRQQLDNIPFAAREVVVDAKDFVVRLYQTIAKMGANEPRATGNQDFFRHFRWGSSVRTLVPEGNF
jgi:hypothetical protein